VFQAFVDSPNVNAARLDVPALEYPVTQAVDPAAMPAVTDRAPIASTVLVTDAVVQNQRSVAQKLAKQTLLQVAQANPAGETVQGFLKTQRSQQSPQGMTVSATPAADDAEVDDDAATIAQAPATPSLFRNPKTETRTEVVEEQVEESTQFDVTTIDIVGNTRFTTAELATYTKPLEGRKITLVELRKAVDSITQLYLSKGYVNSRAFLGNQEVTDGKVTIQILEGSVEAIKVEGNKRLPDDYIIDRLNVETPLRGDKLEEQLRLLQIDPALSSVEASLSPGTAAGKSILTVRVKEAKTAYFGLTSDNYSAPVVGSERYGIYGGLRSSLIPGDEFYASYNRTTSGGSNALDFLYKAPVNKNNGTVQLRVAPSWYKITDEEIGSIFDIDGNSALYELTYRQPIKRTFRNEVALSLGFAFQDGSTNVGNLPLFDTDNRARVLKFGQDFVARDGQGVWAGQSSFNLGLDIFNATNNPSPLADGKFFSWTGQLQRVQRFNADNVTIAQLGLQLSPDAILPSQQFIIGGGQSVRGYRQNARFGDNGLRFSLEHRLVVARNSKGGSVAQVAPFFDMGTVWNSGDNPTPSPNQRFLAGAGLGLILQPLPGLNMRFDYAVPFRKVDEKNDNLQDQAFYFSLGFQP
jgi:hemolysin activation/secretion protein